MYKKTPDQVKHLSLRSLLLRMDLVASLSLEVFSKILYINRYIGLLRTMYPSASVAMLKFFTSFLRKKNLAPLFSLRSNTGILLLLLEFI